MQFFKVRSNGSNSANYKTVHENAQILYRNIASKSKRRPYIRSIYFKKQKIFIALFWQHLFDKNWKERVRRLQYFECGFELIEKTTYPPLTIQNPHKSSELLHRFCGITPRGIIFFVQIKECKKTGEKSLISIFPR